MMFFFFQFFLFYEKIEKIEKIEKKYIYHKYNNKLIYILSLY